MFKHKYKFENAYFWPSMLRHASTCKQIFCAQLDFKEFNLTFQVREQDGHLFGTTYQSIRYLILGFFIQAKAHILF